jgi:hypothetical protein
MAGITRRQRLERTLRGEEVDRPAVSFYEVGGWPMALDGDEFTVWNDVSWRPLVEMALGETDIIRIIEPRWKPDTDDPLPSLTSTEAWQEEDSRFTRTTIRAPGRALTSVERRDKATQTVWTIEHLLKSTEDAESYLRLPAQPSRVPDINGILAEERGLGDSGIVSIDTGDPLCAAASLFSMELYTEIALLQPALFHRLLQRFSGAMIAECDQIARLLPGRLWRIYGSEYASEPYLPPRCYEEYVVSYTGEMVNAIHRHGGFARIHSHGRLRGIIPLIARMRPDALDPLEPPPQGDMELREIREAIGAETVLIGNLEAADIEMLPASEFEHRVVRALREGTEGTGRGFILQPSGCPYGRTITARAMANYRLMIDLARNWAG